MMQNRMQDKRLDLEAPLLSVRRHSAQSAGNPSTKPEPAAATKPLTPSWRPAFPFYNSELKSGPVRNPGVVPFVWEQEPGQPKAGPDSRHRPAPAPLFPPGRTPNDREPNPIFQDSEIRHVNKPTETPATVASAESLKEEEEEDNFSNAVETLSCTESFFMNCSVSGIPDAVEVSGTISTDPPARTLMMERFLPAAQAMAGSSTQCPPRKPSKVGNRVENGEHELRRSPLPYQHLPNFVARYPRDEIDSVEGDDDEYDNNFEGNGHFTSKACGLLPRLCLKSSFCLLNPISGMKVGCRRPIPPATSRKIRSIMQSNIPLSEAEDELWKSMYKHKRSVGIPHQEEGGSRNTSKSNESTQPSDSQKLDEFSPCRSNGDTLVQILKRDMKSGNNGGFESIDKDGERFWAMNSSGSQQESSVLSPAMVKDTHMDAGVLFEIPHSLASSTDREIVFNQRMQGKPVIEGYNGIEHVNSNSGSQFVKGRGQSKNNPSFLHSLLPLPLPNTPSESWLLRTLPSVSSKIPSGKSIFGVHVPRRKVAFQSSSTDLSQESDANPLESSPIFDVKLSKTPRRQIRFADVLMTPLSPRSEM
ncbi:hypothetical protein KSP39_PZI019532 [Platanthera zijinensis]|uniref:Uncharacterized protein n=1 Tax=Platanthera zijinensis TaxID=2320716 RepID=A0AAP0B270_9ASPA